MNLNTRVRVVHVNEEAPVDVLCLSGSQHRGVHLEESAHGVCTEDADLQEGGSLFFPPSKKKEGGRGKEEEEPTESSLSSMRFKSSP